MSTPHRVVGNAVDGLAQGAQGLVKTITGGLKGAGGAIMGALDKPPKELADKEGPHRIVDRYLNGGVNATENYLSEGTVGSLRIFGEGICKALDQPNEQLGIPPALGKTDLMRPRFPELGIRR